MGKRKSPRSIVSKQERNINWMLTCSEPTPLAFFQHIFPSHRGRAIEKYRIVLDLALKETDDREVLSKLRRLKRTVDEARLLFDWETWMQQKAAISVRRSVWSTNIRIHEEINSFAQNKTSQFSYETKTQGREKLAIVTNIMMIMKVKVKVTPCPMVWMKKQVSPMMILKIIVKIRKIKMVVKAKMLKRIIVSKLIRMNSSRHLRKYRNRQN
ncbi:hypothetical protein C1645_587473 [Glomus cerebriforme]|uniref:Uncharacterized protein n=1 Tax=Glomus cerebriforme TaxID=658196 RepID=A0A397TLU1_9GLOM|nr:hypothetical protein C1645_587473 [Glomus cerebriforme]